MDANHLTILRRFRTSALAAIQVWKERNQMKQRNNGAFTLIELLIVVAIIAILALIAVPNFLEAQTRAKISRNKADLRTLATAIESYRVDNATGPFNPFYPDAQRWIIVDRRFGSQHREYAVWWILTTPIAYITSIPKDVFKKEFNEQWGIWQDYYRVWDLSGHPNNNGGWGTSSTPGVGSTLELAASGITILTAGVGPDGVEDIGDGTAGQGGVAGMVFYDPTNGTVSWGDIFYGVPGAFDIYHRSLP